MSRPRAPQFNRPRLLAVVHTTVPAKSSAIATRATREVRASYNVRCPACTKVNVLMKPSTIDTLDDGRAYRFTCANADCGQCLKARAT